MFHVSVEVSQQLYRRFETGVDPLIRILHKPTFGKELALFHSQGASSTHGLNKGFEALIFTIYFAAITSMKAEEVVSIFGMDRTTMRGKYMVAVEQALANARFLQSEELMPLQACVLFNVRRFLYYQSARYGWATDGAPRGRYVCVVRKIHGRP